MELSNMLRSMMGLRAGASRLAARMLLAGMMMAALGVQQAGLRGAVKTAP